MNDEKGFTEIKMSSGWFMTISLQKSDRFEEEKEYSVAMDLTGQYVAAIMHASTDTSQRISARNCCLIWRTLTTSRGSNITS